VAAIPARFSRVGVAPLSAQRSQGDWRLEQAAGYLSGAALGFNGTVMGAGTNAFTPPIWSPGYSTFTGLILAPGSSGVGNVDVGFQLLDPRTQAVVYDDLATNGPIGFDTVVPIFAFGNMFDQGGVTPTSLVWILWQMQVENFEAFPVPVTLELMGDSRCGL
jgi:hypothetical protein